MKIAAGSQSCRRAARAAPQRYEQLYYGSCARAGLGTTSYRVKGNTVEGIRIPIPSLKRRTCRLDRSEGRTKKNPLSLDSGFL